MTNYPVSGTIRRPFLQMAAGRIWDWGEICNLAGDGQYPRILSPFFSHRTHACIVIPWWKWMRSPITRCFFRDAATLPSWIAQCFSSVRILRSLVLGQYQGSRLNRWRIRVATPVFSRDLFTFSEHSPPSRHSFQTRSRSAPECLIWRSHTAADWTGLRGWSAVLNLIIPAPMSLPHPTIQA